VTTWCRRAQKFVNWERQDEPGEFGRYPAALLLALLHPRDERY